MDLTLDTTFWVFYLMMIVILDTVLWRKNIVANIPALLAGNALGTITGVMLLYLIIEITK